MSPVETGQDEKSASLNAEFFAREGYGERVAKLDQYARIREAIDREVDGISSLLDVGNGGVFEYDTGRVGSIVAVDLFLDQIPKESLPPNVEAKRGDALALDEADGTYDAVLEAFLYHHLVGERPEDSVTNTRRAIAEAERTLKPGGRLIVAESCVPPWFYGVEQVAYRGLVQLAKTPLLGGHPATLQLTFDLLVELVGERFEIERAYQVPAGRWTTQFGRRWPIALTPARAFMVVGRKAGEPA